MRDAMSQMAADVFAEMSRDAPGAISHLEPEGHSLNPHVDVERELLGPVPEPPVPSAPWRTQAWAREHPGPALLLTTVGVRWIARSVRRGRWRRHSD
jgi:hypothetical protein